MAVPKARLYHGTPLMIDYTPTAAVAAGDVVVLGNVPLVAHLDIPANRKGALAGGGAVYQMIGNAAIAEKKKVWWDDATGKVSETAGALKVFGWTVSACAADGGFCYVKHAPEM